MAEMLNDFSFAATGIGSVPFLDIESTCLRIATLFPRMPFWPQFVGRSFLEDMSVQYTEGLPLLKVNEEKRTLAVSSELNRESVLANFYERFLNQDLDAFAISRDYAPGLYALMEHLGPPETEKDLYIKGQTVGPITFASGILGLDGKPVIYDAELAEALIQGLGIKAVWQVNKLASSGRKPILFLDEPSLSGFGSAFSSLQRQDVVEKLKMMIAYVRQHADCVIGIHCCGNTDWSMIMEAGPDIVNFDAFGFLDHFLLYSDQIAGFMKKGGAIAWGLVPTSDFKGDEKAQALADRLFKGIAVIGDAGLDRKSIVRQSMLTPACGMGSMREADAQSAVELLVQVRHACREQILSAV